MQEEAKHNLGIKYSLVAKYGQYGNDAYNAKFRYSENHYPIVVYRPICPENLVHNLIINKTVDLKITICGSETTPCIIKAVFNKSVFSPGETAMCRIMCDNSQCGKDVQMFKF